MNLNILDDDTRVRLQRGSNDYINANFVQVPWANRSYILTQVNLLIFFFQKCLIYFL
jgi:protein tyrosine phosphatase